MNQIIQLHQEYCNYKITFAGSSEATLRGEYYIIVPFVRKLELETLEEFIKLERRDIINYIACRNKEKNWSARTIKNNLQALSNFFEYCKDNGISTTNPTEGIRRPKPPNDAPRLVEKEDALRILEWLCFAPFRYSGERERALAIIGMFIFTGVRRTELLNVKNSDVNFKEKILRIYNGKGNKDRVIPMNDRLIEILKEYINSDLKQKNPCVQFFIKLDGKGRMGENSIRALCSRFKKELNIHATPHKFRHSFGSLMANSGCSMRALQNMLGHSSVKTTQRYTYVGVEDTIREMQKHPFGYGNDLPHRNHDSNSLPSNWGKN